VEVVSNPWCFPTLGFSAGGGIELRGTSTEVGDRGRTFYQAHYMIFPLMEWLDILMNGLCLESAGFDMAYITEVDPLWQDDILTAMINPEALLFGNPVSHIACVADSLAAQANAPLDPLFWCKGSWGNAYPLTGNVATHGLVEDAASVAASLIYKLHRELILWGSYGAEGLCGTYPAPIWRKSAYRLQIVSPIAHPTGMGIGQSGIIWGMGKNPPFDGDNFGFLLFKKRDCCVL
jgi:conjugal transfer pilus assembly protein TraU